MPGVPCFCDACGLAFQSGMFGDVTPDVFSAFEDNTVDCPRCGSSARMANVRRDGPHGARWAFDLRRAYEVLRDVPIDAAAWASVADSLDRARAGAISLDRAKAEVSLISPQLVALFAIIGAASGASTLIEHIVKLIAWLATFSQPPRQVPPSVIQQITYVMPAAPATAPPAACPPPAPKTPAAERAMQAAAEKRARRAQRRLGGR